MQFSDVCAARLELDVSQRCSCFPDIVEQVDAVPKRRHVRSARAPFAGLEVPGCNLEPAGAVKAAQVAERRPVDGVKQEIGVGIRGRQNGDLRAVRVIRARQRQGE